MPGFYAPNSQHCISLTRFSVPLIPNTQLEPTGNQTKLLDCYLCTPTLAGRSQLETYSRLVEVFNGSLRWYSKSQNFCYRRSVVTRKPAQSRVHRGYSE
jgi:hypothetical protein